MDCAGITRRYYAHWLGVAPDDLVRPGVRFVFSAERDVIPKGYARRLDVYGWVSGDCVVVSYGSGAQAMIARLEERLCGVPDAQALALAMQAVWSVTPGDNIKYVVDELPKMTHAAHRMAPDDFALYHDFFLMCHPNARDTSWLKEYFDEIVERGLCYGVIEGGMLVSINDLPDMPYMADEVQEIGINTAPAYRGRGLARRVCLSCAHAMADRGICPQWSTTRDNIASQKLARALGFVPLADVVTLTL